jgi:hypothetical protein
MSKATRKCSSLISKKKESSGQSIMAFVGRETVFIEERMKIEP